jgi:hypothetical protein
MSLNKMFSDFQKFSEGFQKSPWKNSEDHGLFLVVECRGSIIYMIYRLLALFKDCILAETLD